MPSSSSTPPAGFPATSPTASRTTDRLRAVTSRPRGRRFAPAGARHRAYATAPRPAAGPAPGPRTGPSPHAPASYRADTGSLPPWMRRTMEELAPDRAPAPPARHHRARPAPHPHPAARQRLPAPLSPAAFAVLCAAVLTAYAIGLLA
ncbi:hypothetical protein [Nocardiopsis potens]|uniref:hypothetical protein n=1 Tax=Nocardiopsis potens TaxID=1246458 RepID=UPI000347F0CC|nr:hypothetical protein [Nocardiopsis potens]